MASTKKACMKCNKLSRLKHLIDVTMSVWDSLEEVILNNFYVPVIVLRQQSYYPIWLVLLLTSDEDPNPLYWTQILSSEL